MLYTFTLETQRRDLMVDITEQVQEFVAMSGIQNGLASTVGVSQTILLRDGKRQLGRW